MEKLIEAEQVIIKYLNLETSIPVGKREFLTFKNQYLMNCSLNEIEDGYTLTFNTTDLSLLKAVQFNNLEKKCLYLINASNLVNLISKYEFSLNPDNIYIDINMSSFVLDRQLGTLTEETFIKEYKALIGTILNPSFTFEDYLKGGTDLFKREKRIETIFSLNTIKEIKDKLAEFIDEENKKIAENKTLVNKNANKARIIVIPIISVLLVAALLAAGYLYFFVLPFKTKIIEAQDAFLNSDYYAVTSILSDIDVEDLPKMTRYSLAMSYLKIADLSQKEKQSESLHLTPISNDVLLNYWIYIGRNDYQNAIDNAYLMNSDNHLYYAYVSYKNYVEKSLSMSGDEKNQLLSTINSEIDKIGEKIRSLNESEVSEEA